ncbi:MAG: hypothetical protein QXX08_10285 [Candidatus Bathyarchaeia archaeon]
MKNCDTSSLIEIVDLLFLSSSIPLFLLIFRIASPFIGVALIGIFAFSLYRMGRKINPSSDKINEKVTGQGAKRTLFLSATITVAAVVVIITAHFVVISASKIVIILDLSKFSIGAKIVAIGTSTPELLFGLIAMKRGRIHLALGDAVGANLTTITLVLGLVLTFSPFAVNPTIFVETLAFVLVTNLILWRYLTKGGISQIGGIVLIMTYILFQAMID